MPQITSQGSRTTKAMCKVKKPPLKKKHYLLSGHFECLNSMIVYCYQKKMAALHCAEQSRKQISLEIEIPSRPASRICNLGSGQSALCMF